MRVGEDGGEHLGHGGAGEVLVRAQAAVVRAPAVAVAQLLELLVGHELERAVDDAAEAGDQTLEIRRGFFLMHERELQPWTMDIHMLNSTCPPIL